MKILGGNNYLYENILPEKEGMLYRVSWSSGNADSKIKRVTQANSTPQDLIVYTDCRVSIIVYTDCPVSIIVYTDGSVSIIVYADGSVTEDLSSVTQSVTTSVSYKVSTSSSTVEIKAVTHVVHRTVSRDHSQTTK